ncbi:Copper chaperone, partial [Dysosmobacter welbionis]
DKTQAVAHQCLGCHSRRFRVKCAAAIYEQDYVFRLAYCDHSDRQQQNHQNQNRPFCQLGHSLFLFLRNIFCYMGIKHGAEGANQC